MRYPSSAILHGCFGRNAEDALQHTNFHSPEWTLVRNRRTLKNKVINISNSDFGICNWNTIPWREVNFEVAPKEDKSTYPRMNYGHRNNEHRQTQQKKNLGTNVNTIPMTKLNKLLNDISSKDLKL
jgi:hypothetical protein